MEILITGHRGFVGRHFVRELYDGNLLTGIDVRDGNDARDFFRRDDRRFDLVIHLAAVVGGRATIEGEPLKVAVDLAIDAELFQWALRTRPGRIVYYSSSAAYPVELQRRPTRIRPGQGGVPTLHENRLREDDIVPGAARQPDLTYGWAKLTGEELARHAEAEGLRVQVFRPFSGYGEDQDDDYPFPAIAARARRREDPLAVWGSGMQARDWIHIDDVVAATLAAVEQDVSGPVNLCTGRATKFVDLARMFADEAGYRPEIETMMAAPQGVAWRVGDPGKMLQFYRPRVELEDGIARAVAA